MSSESASVALPAPEGGAHLSASEKGRIKAHQEACRADIGDRTTCETGAPHPVSGPVEESTPGALRRSVHRSLEAYGGFSILRLSCVNGTRCHAEFALGERRLDMSYRIEALRSVPTCWELTAFSVTRPVPELANFAAPLPARGCVDR